MCVCVFCSFFFAFFSFFSSLQQRESELQERHLKELRQSEEKFNKELSEQRLTLTQSLNDAQDKYKSYKIKCEKHMEKLKKSIECAELEKKSLLEKNVQSGQKIEQLEKVSKYI